MGILGWGKSVAILYRAVKSGNFDKLPLYRDIEHEEAICEDLERKNILEKACLVQFKKNKKVIKIEWDRMRVIGEEVKGKGDAYHV